MSFWQAKTKIRPTDIQFSIFIRKRDKKCIFGFKCISRELTDYETGELDIRNLDTCHFKSRGRESTRFDLENTDAGCKKCHNYIDTSVEGKKAHEEFKKKQLGEKGFNFLLVRSEQTGHRDDKMQKIINEKLLEDLRNEKN